MPQFSRKFFHPLRILRLYSSILMPRFSRKLLHSLHLQLSTPHRLPATPLTALPNELLLLIAELLPPASLDSLLRCSHHLFYLLTPLLHKHVLRDWHATARFPETLYVSTPLLHAASRGYHGLARIVLENQHIPGVTPHLEARCPRGLTALHWATQNCDEAMVRLLLDGGAWVDTTDDNFGETPLHSAARMGHKGVIRLLLQHGAAIDQQSIARATPLSGAAWRVQTGAVALLLERGATVPPVNNRGETPLHWAAEFGSVELVKVLLGHPRFRVGARSGSGKTPLHLAVVRTKDAAEVTRLLLENGADVDSVDGCRRSPVYFALDELLKEYRYKNSKASDRRKREAVVSLLFEHNPWMAGQAILLLEECKKATKMFGRFRMFLENLMATQQAK